MDRNAARIRNKPESPDDLSGRVGDPTQVDEVDGSSPAAERLRSVANALKGLSKSDLDSGNFPANSGVKRIRNIGGGINGISVVTLDDGSQLALKYDRARYGSPAEHAVARMYRDMGLPMPMVREVNPDDKGENGKIILMEWANVVDPNAQGDAVQGMASYDRMGDAAKTEAWLTLVANGVMGNSDRHNGNIMHVTLGDGTERLAIIDNGLAMFNSGFGDNFDHDDPASWLKTRVTPDNFMWSSVGGNSNTLRSLGSSYIREVGKERAKNEMVTFAERMRQRAKVLRFKDKREAEFMEARAQWVIDNADTIVNGGGRF